LDERELGDEFLQDRLEDMVARGIKTRDGELHEMLTGRGLTRTVGYMQRRSQGCTARNFENKFPDDVLRGAGPTSELNFITR
jgi:hypothetical protein